jgi:hypothetical protein
MTYPVCPCDGEQIAPPVNLPELSYISYRVGTYVAFRQAVLTPLFTPATPLPLPDEQTLSVNGVPVWRTDGAGDLAVMIAEWFAYIADIITFYNERIANQDYLRTADLPESVNNLIALLGYRPRPAIGAVGNLAALLSSGPTFGGQSIVLPQGLQFQSKPSPGQTPQTFELSAATSIGGPDQLPAMPPPVLVGTVSAPRTFHYSAYHEAYWIEKFSGGSGIITISGESSLLLQGSVTTIDPGALLRLRSRDGTNGLWLATVVSSTSGPSPSGSGQQTSLVVTLSGTPPTTLTAATATLEKANQTVGLWRFFAGAISSDGITVHLASLVRQIEPDDWLLFTASGSSPRSPVLAQVASIKEVIWDANATSASKPTFTATTTTTTDSSTGTTTTKTTNPIPVPHTRLTLTTATALVDWSNATSVTAHFGWVSVGVLLNQPFSAWTGAPTSLISASAQAFPSWNAQPILLQDATGIGIAASGSLGTAGALALGKLPDPVPSLQPPFLVLPNLLTVSRGKTVTNEVLGSGDATNPAQDFKLSQSPVTYLSHGATYASTIQLTVNNLPWTEVASFYGQAPDATVFVTREDNQGNTHVMFGDGLAGARLPTGVNNVVATYRVGAGAASPPAGKLTVIAKSYPGLRAVLNPVAVSGGSDPDPPDQIRRYAPRSVLTFGRAVSVFDFEALAAQVPGVTRASAVWAWNDTRQRTLVTVYVGDDSGAAAAATTALAAAGDPNRPVLVVQATQIPVALTLTLLVTPGMDTTIITAAVVTALTDIEVGLFGAWNMGIGQTVFESQIEAAVLGVSGAVALTAQGFIANGITEAGPLHNPGEGAFYTLDPADINLTPEPDPNG